MNVGRFRRVFKVTNSWIPLVSDREGSSRCLCWESLLFRRGKSGWCLHRRTEIEFRSKSPILPWSDVCPGYPLKRGRMASIRLLHPHKPHPKEHIVSPTFGKIPWKRFSRHVNKSLEPVLLLDDQHPTRRSSVWRAKRSHWSLTLITWPVRGLMTRKYLSLHDVTMREPL